MYNEIGLGQNFNMKRERLVSAEIDQIKDSIYPYVYDMLKCRLKALEKLNAKYGLAIAVDFGSVWNANVKSHIDDVIPAGQPLVNESTVEEPVVATAPVEEQVAEAAPVVEPVEPIEPLETAEAIKIVEVIEAAVVEAVAEVLDIVETKKEGE